MPNVTYLPPNDDLPLCRHVVVITHREGPRNTEKAYFYDSEKGDWGGRALFDLSLNETLDRAARHAAENNIDDIFVLPK